jgi:hypothetical protein
MGKFLLCIAIFQAGGVVYVNLSLLLPINDLYNASWWKVGPLLVFAIFLSRLITNDKGGKNGQ